MNGEKDSKDKLVSLEDSIKESQQKLSKLEEASFDIKIYVQDKIKEVEQKIDSSKTDIIQALGIFVALFAFIAINVQIFTKISDLGSAMWFMLVMGGVTIIILLTIETLIDSHREYPKSEKLKIFERLKQIITSKIFLLAVLAIVQIVAGFYFTYKNPVQLNSGKIESTKLEIQADIKSTDKSDIFIDSN